MVTLDCSHVNPDYPRHGKKRLHDCFEPFYKYLGFLHLTLFHIRTHTTLFILLHEEYSLDICDISRGYERD
jgi:hypothetical protein